ncbi:MAG: hypothetical protein IJ272_06520 [Clostridia bacterium]|nr:hypothetical protein [Clostridia bacterium]
MAKKINCKHGLDKKQEIEARRLRVKLEQGDEETLAKYHKIYVAWYYSKEPNFADFLKRQDIIFYSAYARITDKTKHVEVKRRIMFYGLPEYCGIK